MAILDLENSPLGKDSCYDNDYDTNLLFAIPRQVKRDEIDVPQDLPFAGADIWNAYELSWLNNKGKPQVAIGEFIIPCTSKNIIESKSLKLYLNSFNQARFHHENHVKETLQNDLSQAVAAKVTVNIVTPREFTQQGMKELNGTCIDALDVMIDTYKTAPSLLGTMNTTLVEELLYSNLLKSNCLGTGQPDWGSVQIHYHGPKIDHEGLLKYIISFRNHNEFHEQCVERIFMDIMQYCQPEKLTVYARYTRRGGLDINPFRSNFEDLPENIRISRQ